MARVWLVALFVAWALVVRPAFAAPSDGSIADADEDCVKEVGTCPVDLEGLDDEADASVAPLPTLTPPTPPERDAGAQRLLFFWGIGCPHCEAAQPFLGALERGGVQVERVEVRQDPAGRKRFVERMKQLRAGAVGIPTFVIGDAYVVGFTGQPSEREVRALLRGEQRSVGAVELPLIGSVDPSRVSLPAFTLLVGLLDGVNPCAMWVLLVLLSILVHVKSRKRLLLFGGTFVVASGAVYFAFMTAWVGIFSLVGLSRHVTVLLGLIVLGMGLINLKELIWFKQGVSLMIPDKAKPGLYRRMREIAGATSFPAAFLGIALLAFFVNLIELGCTLGLPAVYTRILTSRSDLSALGRYGYLALYNLAYVVPLALIVLVYVATLHRLTLSERGAKVLKGVSGVLLVTFGLFLMLAPGVLS